MPDQQPLRPCGRILEVTEEAKFAIALRIQSRLEQVRFIRAAMAGVLKHAGIVESDILSLELAVTELVNNCLEHGYQGLPDKHVEVQIGILDKEVQIDVIDHAPPFPENERYRLRDKSTPVEESDDAWEIRGHGLRIVQQIVDRIELASGENRNILTIRKYVSLEAN
jgi:anti-sigma regulatory factor (Ser/Thr protein kinase)